MRSVEYEGDRYLLVKESEEASLVRDPETGTERYLPNDALTVTGDTPLATAAETIPEPKRRLLTAVHSESILGLLVELDGRGPLSVRQILDQFDLCESDLHGQVTELRAAGLVDETDVAGEPGYETTALARKALSGLR